MWFVLPIREYLEVIFSLHPYCGADFGEFGNLAEYRNHAFEFGKLAEFGDFSNLALANENDLTHIIWYPSNDIR